MSTSTARAFWLATIAVTATALAVYAVSDLRQQRFNDANAQESASRDGEPPATTRPARGDTPSVTESADEPSTELRDDDPEDAAWDSVSPARRTQILRRDFDTALASIEGGQDAVRNTILAEQALTALRAEMYESPSGRRGHQLLEEQLSAAVGGEADERPGYRQEGERP